VPDGAVESGREKGARGKRAPWKYESDERLDRAAALLAFGTRLALLATASAASAPPAASAEIAFAARLAAVAVLRIAGLAFGSRPTIVTVEAALIATATTAAAMAATATTAMTMTVAVATAAPFATGLLPAGGGCACFGGLVAAK
jgi:hypothetical protein